MGEGSTRDHDPERIAVSGALCECSGTAYRGRGVRDRAGPAVSEREGDRERGRSIARPIGTGSSRVARWAASGGRLVGCGSALLGLLARASAGPVGLVSAGPFPFFLN